jgi:hypothetical protein
MVKSKMGKGDSERKERRRYVNTWIAKFPGWKSVNIIHEKLNFKCPVFS